MPMATKTVLITGASSGIGAATARRLASSGFKVYASARKIETLDNLKAAGCQTLRLDVTDEASMRQAVDTILTRETGIDALVNNAGYCQSGALEPLPMAEVRRQFETNVFGPLRLTQLVLPAMRKAGTGRIINISSMGGKLTFPGAGAYHASKYAVESLSDALRFEVAGFGIDVVLIEPGLIRSGFAEAVAAHMPAAHPTDPYVEFDAAVVSITKSGYERGLLARLGGAPDDVAKVIERALTAKRPRARYAVTASAHVLMAVRALLPDRLWDRLVGRSFPQPGRRV